MKTKLSLLLLSVLVPFIGSTHALMDTDIYTIMAAQEAINAGLTIHLPSLPHIPRPGIKDVALVGLTAGLAYVAWRYKKDLRAIYRKLDEHTVYHKSHEVKLNQHTVYHESHAAALKKHTQFHQNHAGALARIETTGARTDNNLSKFAQEQRQAVQDISQELNRHGYKHETTQALIRGLGEDTRTIMTDIRKLETNLEINNEIRDAQLRNYIRDTIAHRKPTLTLSQRVAEILESNK